MTNDNAAEVHRVGDVWRLDLPSDIAAQLGWVDGQKVHVEVDLGLLLVTPQNDVLLLTALAAVTRQLSRRTTEVHDALNEAIKRDV